MYIVYVLPVYKFWGKWKKEKKTRHTHTSTINSGTAKQPSRYKPNSRRGSLSPQSSPSSRMHRGPRGSYSGLVSRAIGCGCRYRSISLVLWLGEETWSWKGQTFCICICILASFLFFFFSTLSLVLSVCSVYQIKAKSSCGLVVCSLICLCSWWSNCRRSVTLYFVFSKDPSNNVVY